MSNLADETQEIVGLIEYLDAYLASSQELDDAAAVGTAFGTPAQGADTIRYATWWWFESSQYEKQPRSKLSYQTVLFFVLAWVAKKFSSGPEDQHWLAAVVQLLAQDLLQVELPQWGFRPPFEP